MRIMILALVGLLLAAPVMGMEEMPVVTFDNNNQTMTVSWGNGTIIHQESYAVITEDGHIIFPDCFPLEC